MTGGACLIMGTALLAGKAARCLHCDMRALLYAWQALTGTAGPVCLEGVCSTMSHGRSHVRLQVFCWWNCKDRMG